VRPHIALPTIELGQPSSFATLEAYGEAPIVEGNRLEVLLNGEQIFPARLAAIRGARTTITYAEYYYQGGRVASEVVEALAERCRAGVGVNVLLDAFGTLQMPTEHTELMRRSGCAVASFRPLSHLVFGRANNRNHRRILVVDGRVGFTGGSGIDDKWLGNGRLPDNWRETDVRIEGPVVRYLQGAFAENWLEATGMVLGGAEYFPPLASRGPVRAQVVTSAPGRGDFALYTTFLLAIASANRSVYITNPYFVLDDKMAAALMEAAARGARVLVIVPGRIDHNLVRQASRRQFGKLMAAGIEIYEYRAALLHAKTIVIDGLWSTIGSTNLDNRSFALNDELNLFVYGRDVAQRLEKTFKDDLAHSRRVADADWRARPVWQRMLETLALPIRDQL
jgi:cardiolipin synthase